MDFPKPAVSVGFAVAATGTKYAIPVVAESHEGSYTVAVTNVTGAVTSGVAVLSVNDPVMITVQPVDRTVNPGHLRASA